MEFWRPWKTWLKENSVVSTVEEGWLGVISLRGKEDKEKWNQHFFNLECAARVHWWLQKAADTRHQHNTTTAHPRRAAERQKCWWDKILGKSHPNTEYWQCINSGSRWSPFPQVWWGREPQLFPAARSPAWWGHCAARSCQDRRRTEQTCVTLL